DPGFGSIPQDNMPACGLSLHVDGGEFVHAAIPSRGWRASHVCACEAVSRLNSANASARVRPDATMPVSGSRARIVPSAVRMWVKAEVMRQSEPFVGPLPTMRL